MILQPVDPNERFHIRRRHTLRRRRLRRAAGGAIVLAAAGAAALGVQLVAGGRSTPASEVRTLPRARKAAAPTPRTLPYEIRGVHVTMALAGIPGKLDHYLVVPGLNTIELDVKDENGKVGFVSPRVPLARAIGAAQPYYDAHEAADQVHGAGVYLIGRVVTFEDPVLAEQRPGLAIHTRDGGIWRNRAELGWTNEYDRRVWRYDVDVAEAAVRAGFDEIQFDYVRFPSDGDISNAVWPGKRAEPEGRTILRFLTYATRRLHPLGVRVSVDVFGLAATRDLGIGQVPRRLGGVVDAVYPMVYPSHFNAGEYSIADPNGAPGQTVERALRDFQRQLRGRPARLVPWLQDFSLGRTYTYAEVVQQIEAARRMHASGFLLWNPLGVYTNEALDAP